MRRKLSGETETSKRAVNPCKIASMEVRKGLGLKYMLSVSHLYNTSKHTKKAYSFLTFSEIDKKMRLIWSWYVRGEIVIGRFRSTDKYY